METKNLDADQCTPTSPIGAAPSDSASGSATSIGLVSVTALANVQGGAIKAVGGTAGGSITNTTRSTVEQTGGAAAGTGDVGEGAAQSSSPASALGATTSNLISDVSTIAVTVGGANEAQITATSDHERVVRDTGLAGASTAAAGTNAVTPATNGVTGGNANAAVTPSTGVTADPASPQSTASCVANAATNKIEGKAEKTVTAPSTSGAPIAINIGQQAKVTNLGTSNGNGASGAAPVANTAPSTTGSATAPAAAAPAPAPATNGSGAADAHGLQSTNTVANTAMVDVSIKGNNYAPITIAIKTVTTIVNNAIALVQTAAGGEPAAGGSTGVGARVANDVRLDSSAIVDVAGDNHSPITIVLDIGAELWNKGMALVGLGGGSDMATADGLQVDNLLSLLGRASVHIDGDNYAPIDIQILLHNLIYNEGVARAQSLAQTAPRAAQDAAGSALETARHLSSGPASCLSLAGSTAVANAQIANVRMPSNPIVGQVLAGNTHVVDVQGVGAAQCTTGNAPNGSTGDVLVGAATTVLTVVTTQTADTSAKTDPSEDETTPGDGGGNTGGGNTGGGNNGGGSGVHPVEVVVAVTTTPVVSRGKVANKGKKIVRNEDVWEWQVEWVPLYVIYPPKPKAPAPIDEGPQSETTTSMAGAYTTPIAPVTQHEDAPLGLSLFEQLALALLGLLAFVVIRVLRRRLAVLAARRAAINTPELSAPALIVVPSGSVEAAAE